MSDQERLDELLDRWEESMERGLPITAEELCADCPDLLPRLKEQIEALRSMDAWMSTTIQLQEPVRRVVKAEDVILKSHFGELSVHAQGGLGIVYSATDQDLFRSVALKFLQQQCATDEASRRQFSIEAEVTSRLEHPGVVPVYGLGESEDGRPFYAMRFIEGDTLDDAIARFFETHDQISNDSSLEFRALLNHFVSVCKTIAYAHNRGILHRDIKPANVMLGRYGETLVVDWGLAMAIGRRGQFKHDDEKTLMPLGLSQRDSSNGLAGTPAYMSPEHVAGSDALEPASDVYALGSTLYKILTGRVPFDAESLAELRQKIIRGEYAPPSEHQPDVPRPLQAICLKAMSINADQRYPTAMDLANDVERYLADEPVEAYKESLDGKLARWSRRHRRVVQTAALAGMMVLLLTLFFSVWQARTAHRATMARYDGNVSRASVAANALASELDRRLLILEGAARDQQLIDALESAKDDPTNRDIWNRVNDRLLAQRLFWTEDRGLVSYAWFVNLNDGKGTQIARAPRIRDDGTIYESIGREYSEREYFHGLGPSPPGIEPYDLDPIQEPHLSAPFQGTHGQPVLAFTVPVKSMSGGPTLGVLGMAVEVFDLTSLDADIGTGQLLTIIHERPDYFNKETTQRGLIMQHEHFRNRPDQYQTVWVDRTILDRIDQSKDVAFLETDYQDPMRKFDGAYRQPWVAAFAPVLISGRELWPNEPTAMPEYSGWYVVIQERP